MRVRRHCAYQSEGGTPNGVMKLPGRVMAGGVVPAGGFCYLFFFSASPCPGTTQTRDPPATMIFDELRLHIVFVDDLFAENLLSKICVNLKIKLFKILDAEKIGMKLTENYSMIPAASVSGLYFANKNSKYFNI